MPAYDRQIGNSMYIEKIKETNDIKKIEKEHLDELAQEIRDFLIEKCL